MAEALLEKRWNEILEKYYERTNPLGFRTFIAELKRANVMQNSMTAVEAAFLLYGFGFRDEIEDMLKKLGIYGNTQQKVSQKRTKFSLLMAKMSAKQKHVAKTDYYNLLGVASRQTGRNLDSEMLLVVWIGILNDIKQEHARKNRESGNNKRRGPKGIR